MRRTTRARWTRSCLTAPLKHRNPPDGRTIVAPARPGPNGNAERARGACTWTWMKGPSTSARGTSENRRVRRLASRCASGSVGCHETGMRLRWGAGSAHRTCAVALPFVGGMLRLGVAFSAAKSHFAKIKGGLSPAPQKDHVCSIQHPLPPAPLNARIQIATHTAWAMERQPEMSKGGTHKTFPLPCQGIHGLLVASPSRGMCMRSSRPWLYFGPS